jgi:hypothetical protein
MMTTTTQPINSRAIRVPSGQSAGRHVFIQASGGTNGKVNMAQNGMVPGQ